ncbi:MAG: hypothetical protein ACLPJH_10520 [Myxococcaceae bacterium]
MSTRRLPFAVVCLLWAGIVIGISFIEAPVKFRAPTLTRIVAFDVGRTVFAASQWVQASLALLAVGLAVLGRVPRWAWVCLGLGVGTLLVQMGWLFPLLDARAQTIISGGVPSGPNPHGAYGVLEVAKLLALVTGGVLAMLPAWATTADATEP